MWTKIEWLVIGVYESYWKWIVLTISFFDRDPLNKSDNFSGLRIMGLGMLRAMGELIVEVDKGTLYLRQ